MIHYQIHEMLSIFTSLMRRIQENDWVTATVVLLPDDNNGYSVSQLKYLFSFFGGLTNFFNARSILQSEWKKILKMLCSLCEIVKYLHFLRKDCTYLCYWLFQVFATDYFPRLNTTQKKLLLLLYLNRIPGNPFLHAGNKISCCWMALLLTNDLTELKRREICCCCSSSATTIKAPFF